MSGWLRDEAGIDADKAASCAAALAVDGYDSIRALRAGSLTTAELTHFGIDADAAARLSEKLAPEVTRWLSTAGLAPATAGKCTAALAAAGFDSMAALRAGKLPVSELEDLGATSVDAAMIDTALTADGISGMSLAASSSAETPVVDPEAVPLDDLLINSLIKLAGGQKKGTTFPSHMRLAELHSRLLERMSQFYQVVVEGEAPLNKKGSLKNITIDMKRAAGHNKTHIAGLESFLISPEAVAQALKIQLGCTTAVLKLPGNNVKEQEVLLQGHCVNEVVEYLQQVYCVGKEWIDLKLKDSKK